MTSNTVRALLSRDESIEQKFLNLMKDPFGQEIAEDAILYAIGTSLATTTAIFLGFCLLRPFNAIVYAPRSRHTDEKHRPPPMGKGLFAWWDPVFKTHEDDYVEKIGLDATIFLRIARMGRNLFIVLALTGCAILIPINVIGTQKQQKIMENIGQASKVSAILMMTPRDLYGQIFWAFVGVAYMFDIIICAYLWVTYRAVHRLRRKYLDSSDYQSSLHSRTLMITDVKRSLRSDQGLLDVVDSLRTTPEVPRAAIGRNVKDLPELIEEHEQAVMDLEKVLAKYLRNPNKLPATRPLCKPSKKDPEYENKEKIDAITYLTARIERLEFKIKEVRETVDKRDALPYGFASYETLESAHSVAYTAKNKHPKGTTVNLAPRPNDILWKNLPLDAKTRRWRRFINSMWITLLTVLYFIPNALIAVFLAKLSNLALIEPKFGVIMAKDPNFWAIVQGIAAPAITSAFYYFLPIIFRKMSMQAGDLTKTSRERHVINQLYSFFVFNNLFIFSVFAATFGLITAAISAMREGGHTFRQVIHQIDPLTNVMTALCNVSPFWVTWLVQRNLGAAIDLAQFVNLAWGSFSRKFLHPTPRELIKRTAPPPFDYASYYNYFLFYATVALCFASLQPITLIVTAFYFSIDASMKKYLLLYVFCTKYESGGLYWRIIFNRLLVAAFFSNCVIALLCAARGFEHRKNMLTAMVPLPLFLIAFKFYCKYAFDSSIKYYTKGDTGKGAEAPAPIDKESRRRDRVAVRFGHPSLWQKLTVPMVHEKSKHLLTELYRGRLDGDLGSTAGYSDVYMKRMSKETPGKVAETTGPFEFVSEGNMDFENFKNRPEFSNDHGGEGSVYGARSSIGRPDTSAGSVRDRSQSRDSERTFGDDDTTGILYQSGYHTTPSALQREFSPGPDRFGRTESNESNPYQMRDQTGLLSQAAPMGHQQPEQRYTPYTPDGQGGRQDYFRR